MEQQLTSYNFWTMQLVDSLFRDLFIGEHYKNVDYDESDFDKEGNLKFDEDNNHVAPFWLMF